MNSRIETACKCDACKQMCRRSVCFGTPNDILQLINGGFEDKLQVSYWLDLEWNGHWPLITPIQLDNGCIFLTTDGLCHLHDLKLKPTEGRLSHHAIPDLGLRRGMCFTWVNQLGYDVLSQFGDAADLDRLTELRLAYNR